MTDFPTDPAEWDIEGQRRRLAGGLPSSASYPVHLSVTTLTSSPCRCRRTTPLARILT